MLSLPLAPRIRTFIFNGFQTVVISPFSLFTTLNNQPLPSLSFPVQLATTVVLPFFLLPSYAIGYKLVLTPVSSYSVFLIPLAQCVPSLSSVPINTTVFILSSMLVATTRPNTSIYFYSPFVFYWLKLAFLLVCSPFLFNLPEVLIPVCSFLFYLLQIRLPIYSSLFFPFHSISFNLF